MTNQKKPAVVMTSSGNAKSHPAGADIREILDTIYTEHQTAGSDWDRPDRLFIGGELIVEKGLADIAWEFGKFFRKKDEELDAALDEWIEQRFHQKEALCHNPKTDSSGDAATRLVRALKEANAPHGMILNAQEGYYGDFTSSLATPITQLVNDLYAYNLHALAKRAMNGEFDGR